MSAHPHFLIVKLPGATEEDLHPFAAAAEKEGGVVLARAGQDSVEALEPGTRHTALLIARFAHKSEIDRAWSAWPSPPLPPDSQVLTAPGLPWEGWPSHFVPTIATVDVPDGGGPPAWMLIEGTGTDDAAMDSYRDIILPMLRARGAYYPAFEFNGGVCALHGTFGWAFLAISRWPTLVRAQDFWFSDEYQHRAIPMRTGAGSFEVQVTQGIAG